MRRTTHEESLPSAEERRIAAELRAELAGLRQQNAELRAEKGALLAQLEGDIPKATRWLQGKVLRQAAALDLLNERVVTQRFVLRTLEELGRGLSKEEYAAARAAALEERPLLRIA